MPGLVELGGERAVSDARAVVASSLVELGLTALRDDAQLIASELVGNALLHGQGPVTLSVKPLKGGVRIEIADTSPTLPMRGLGATDAMTGRGLRVVEALASDWGAVRTSPGKVIWAVLSTQPLAESLDDISAEELLARWTEIDDEAAGGDGRFDIELGDVPTHLLVAAKTHVDNLVREFSLATAASGEPGVVAETSLSARLAELLHTVTTRFAEARAAIKKQALSSAARSADRTHLSIRLRPDAAEAGEEYLRVLDEIDRYCRGARLLTLESPSAHRVFRRWYVGEIVSQLRAAESRRAATAVSFESFLLHEVERLVASQAAIDRASRLSRVAAALVRADAQDGAAKAVVDEAVAGLGANAGALLIRRTDRISVAAAVGYPAGIVAALDNELIEAELPAATALRTGEAVWLASVTDLLDSFPALAAFEPGTASLCVVPLTRHRRTTGALRLSFAVPRVFDFDERTFITALAAQAALALDTAYPPGPFGGRVEAQ